MKELFLTMILVFCVGLFLPLNSVWGHTGIVDGYGCHVDRKTGRYHCHQGPYIGQSFESKAEFLKKLRGGELEHLSPKEVQPKPKQDK